MPLNQCHSICFNLKKGKYSIKMSHFNLIHGDILVLFWDRQKIQLYIGTYFAVLVFYRSKQYSRFMQISAAFLFIDITHSSLIFFI